MSKVTKKERKRNNRDINILNKPTNGHRDKAEQKTKKSAKIERNKQKWEKMLNKLCSRINFYQKNTDVLIPVLIEYNAHTHTHKT